MLRKIKMASDSDDCVCVCEHVHLYMSVLLFAHPARLFPEWLPRSPEVIHWLNHN